MLKILMILLAILVLCKTQANAIITFNQDIIIDANSDYPTKPKINLVAPGKIDVAYTDANATVKYAYWENEKFVVKQDTGFVYADQVLGIGRGNGKIKIGSTRGYYAASMFEISSPVVGDPNWQVVDTNSILGNTEGVVRSAAYGVNPITGFGTFVYGGVERDQSGTQIYPGFVPVKFSYASSTGWNTPIVLVADGCRFPRPNLFFAPDGTPHTAFKGPDPGYWPPDGVHASLYAGPATAIDFETNQRVYWGYTGMHDDIVLHGGNTYILNVTVDGYARVFYNTTSSVTGYGSMFYTSVIPLHNGQYVTSYSGYMGAALTIGPNGEIAALLHRVNPTNGNIIDTILATKGKVNDDPNYPWATQMINSTHGLSYADPDIAYDENGELYIAYEETGTASTGIRSLHLLTTLVGNPPVAKCGDPGVPYKTTDLNTDCNVDTEDLKIFAQNWLKLPPTSLQGSLAQKNPLIYAPQINAITIDGSLADWQASSDWAVFGKWYANGTGLTSTSKAKYAWNDSANLLYIGIESGEGSTLIMELGGLMGNLSDPNATPLGGTQATQLELKNWSGGVPTLITNQLGGIKTGVSAAYAINGGTITIEIALPIYSDWKNAATAMNLFAQMDVYTYINIVNAGWTAGDSLCANGTQVYYVSNPVIGNASLIRLLQGTSPQSCSDYPDIVVMGNPDYNEDCIVNFKDFATFASDWLVEY